MFPAICLALFLLLHHPVAFADTLGKLLRSRSIPAGGLAAGDLDARISGPAILDDPHTVLIAYYQDGASGSIKPPLILRRLHVCALSGRGLQGSAARVAACGLC